MNALERLQGPVGRCTDWHQGTSKNPQFRVIPAKAGIQPLGFSMTCNSWIPAFAGMTQIFRYAHQAFFVVELIQNAANSTRASFTREPSRTRQIRKNLL